MKDYDYYLFDFDGTIMDTERSIKSCVVYALDFYGIGGAADATLDNFIGPPLFDSFKKYFGASDERAKELVQKYRERYHAGGCYDCTLYDGVLEVFLELKKRGKKIAVASSKPEGLVKMISDYHDISRYYDAVSAESLENTSSDKRELIENALAMLGCTDKARALMIGDRYLDIEGALKAGVDSAGAVFGFGTEEELKTAGATYLLHKASDLLA